MQISLEKSENQKSNRREDEGESGKKNIEQEKEVTYLRIPLHEFDIGHAFCRVT